MDPKSRPAATGQNVYEDVEPQYQWLAGNDADSLIVNLTGFKGAAGFKKEHLKVKIDNYGNLKVSGERPLPAAAAAGGNRWRRFQKVCRVAEDCSTSEIKAKFDNGVLTVVMPKLPKDHLPSPPSPTPEAAAQTPSATPAAPEPVPAVKPEPTAAPSPTNAPEEGKGPAPSPAVEKPAPPRASEPPPPAAETATRRRPRWAAVVMVVAVVAAVGLGFFYWRCRIRVGPYEQQLQMEGFGDDY